MKPAGLGVNFTRYHAVLVQDARPNGSLEDRAGSRHTSTPLTKWQNMHFRVRKCLHKVALERNAKRVAQCHTLTLLYADPF